jgi:hypothetical protein
MYSIDEIAHRHPSARDNVIMPMSILSTYYREYDIHRGWGFVVMSMPILSRYYREYDIHRGWGFVVMSMYMLSTYCRENNIHTVL